MNKIMKIEELERFITEAKVAGKEVVLAHGCFDLLHPGHIRHLRAAKKHGDMLVVTITPDNFVNKGPGRPVFSEDLRLETIAALEFVDAVALNKWPTAVEMINYLKPSIYIKGSDYENPEDDPTGNIILERKAVEYVGGRIEFTYEITFSSTSLLNEHFNVFPKNAEEYLYNLSKKFDPDKIIELFKPMENYRVVVIGDTIIDEYTYVHPMGRVEKAPIVACRYLDTEFFAGGILAVANHIANFVKHVDLITVVGNDNLFDRISSKLSSNIKVHLFKRLDGPTTLKRRYLHKDDYRKMFALEFMNDRPISQQVEKQILNKLHKILTNADLTVVADFGHGIITGNMIDELISYSRFLSVNAQTNSSNFGFNPISRYYKASFISIDETELRIATRKRFEEVEEMYYDLIKYVDCPRINVTLGPRGSYYFADSKGYRAPALTNDVIDTVGAGDAVLSIISICSVAGFPDEIIPFIGNCAGAIAANILCNKKSVEKVDLFKMIKAALSWE